MQICNAQRHLIDVYNLKKRNYIGNTSMEAEVSLLMANQALVRFQDTACSNTELRQESRRVEANSATSLLQGQARCCTLALISGPTSLAAILMGGI